MFRKNKKVWVTASNAGSAVFCPHSLQLRYSGAKVSRQARLAMNEGIQGHNAVNAAAAADSRCFVATKIYGEQNKVTCNLRTFRDEFLARSPAGRLFIQIYYWLSPYLVRVIDRVPPVAKCARKIIDLIVGEKRNLKRDASND